MRGEDERIFNGPLQQKRIRVMSALLLPSRALTSNTNEMSKSINEKEI